MEDVKMKLEKDKRRNVVSKLLLDYHKMKNR